MGELRICIGCKKALPATAENFYRKSAGGYLDPRCKPCRGKMNQESYRANPEQRYVSAKKWREANPEKVARYYTEHRKTAKGKATLAKWQAANPAKLRAASLRYYYRHRDQALAEAAEYRKNNAERFKAYRQKYKADGRTAEGQRRYKEAHREELNERSRRRYAKLDKKVIAEYAHRRRVQIRGVSDGPVDLAATLAIYGMVCHLCGEAIPEGDLHFDHVIPLSKGGRHSMDNIKPAHGGCNRRKSAKLLT